MKALLPIAAAAVALIGAFPAAHAATQIGDYFSFSGFGTLGAVVTDTDNAQYRAATNQDKGADRSPDLGVDSRLGVQATANFNSTFSAVGQLLAKRADGKDVPRVEWLYGQAKVTDWLTVRGGRMVLPVFLVSDSRNVGYASHWLRAPQEVYALYNLSSFDGLQAQVRTAWGGVNLTAQLSAATTKAKGKLFGDFNLDLELEKLRSINLVAEYGDWTVRYGRTTGRSTLTGIAFPDSSDGEVFSGLGLQYDNGTALVMAERVQRRQDSGGGDGDAFYVTAGWRFGSVMPYLTHAKSTPKGFLFLDTTETGTNAFGLRWDAYKNLAVKAQLESTNASTNWVNRKPGYSTSATKVKVLSFAVDFVF